MTTSNTHYMGTGDLLPIITATLLDRNGDPVDLTGASVTFRMRDHASGYTAVNDAVAMIDGDPTDGQVSYVWVAGDTDRHGEYLAEWIVTIDSKQQTVPNDGWVTVVIKRR